MKRRTFLVGSAAGTIATTVLRRGHRGAEGTSRTPGELNLLRNGDFQDDWLSLIAENRTLHWAYPNAIHNRRDFNPDGWRCHGSWEWIDADKPYGSRRLMLRAPDAQIVQRLHWYAIHDDRIVKSFPDAGGFSELQPLYSRAPERLVRDLTLRALVRGKDLASNAGVVELGLCVLGSATMSDPLGAVVKPLVSVTIAFPSGSFDWRWLELQLPAAAWLKAAANLPVDRDRARMPGLLLPAVISVALRFHGRTGSIELDTAELVDPGPAAPNLLPNGGFDAAAADGYPTGWGRPTKYRYFPPGHYYLFNTWHNAMFDNRGLVARDRLITHDGTGSLKMIVPSGDEVSVASHPARLDQREPRLIEVVARVKTDRLCMLAIDAVDQNGDRLDGFHFIHKAPVSIGTNDWRVVAQVFRPRKPVTSCQLLLCARGANGYTLDATSFAPQNNVVGTIWWDDVRVYEPESRPDELAARNVAPASAVSARVGPHLIDLDLGERLFGGNLLTALLVNTSDAGTFALRWEFTSPRGQRAEFTSTAVAVPRRAQQRLHLTYLLEEPCREPYTEYRGRLTLLRDDRALDSTELWFSTWAAPIDLKLGALYLAPEQTQLVRVNFGLSAAAMATFKRLRLEIIRRGSGGVLHTVDVPVTPAAIVAQRHRIPVDLRGDLTNLLLADLDVSVLPIQPFDDPQRNWVVRATAVDEFGRPMVSVESEPFCRQAHAARQPPITHVTVGRDNLLRVNGEPWIPWGATYGFVPAYSGPADPGPRAHRDLRALPERSIYDGFTAELYSRRDHDYSCTRDVAGKITPRERIEHQWTADNRYASTAFLVPSAVFSKAELVEKAGGSVALKAYLDFCKHAPMVVATAPGIEETFGLFHAASPEQLRGLRDVVEYLRGATNKPVMVGHGGYWNRLEFEKVPYFDIYDPETEPFYPASLHTDLRPLVHGQAKVIWLRPQMYEDVPYERWRFHVYTELMRGCRGWQIAHGPGDASLARGLHGEIEFLKPIVASRDAGPRVRIEPRIEHWSRRLNGKTYIIAATTHGLVFGRWRAGEYVDARVGRARISDGGVEYRDETNAYGLDGPPLRGAAAHGVQFLPDARSWPAGSRLVQWVRLERGVAPDGFAVLVKADGRFTRVASWGRLDVGGIRRDPQLSVWFLRTLYRHAAGFLGWDAKLLPAALSYIPDAAAHMGAVPPAGTWTRLEVPLERIGADRRLVDGVGFLHGRGAVEWGRTSIVGADGDEVLVRGDSIGFPPEHLAQTKISVDGLAAGTRVRVLFEARELKAAPGYFIDDFRGRDLYQRFGGGPTLGYGDVPVAVHAYEVG